MKIKSFLLLVTMSFSLVGFAQMPQVEELPKDAAVRYGKLDNGLTYYIRHNELPKNRCDFYIAQRVGSILENEEQRGLAHFLEHMCFNGTKNFPGKKIINYLEENGVQFGGDLNAYTSIDETVYNIANVPTVRPELVDSCLLILHDWSGYVSLLGEEIDSERGVIHEEWRTSTNAALRIYDQILPKLFPDSNRYAYRMPIGLMEVVDNFPHQVLRDYYHKWYRPDLQGIIVVGDIDVDKIEQRIKEMWQDIQTPENVAERIYYTVADNEKPIVAVGTDKEFPYNTISFGYKYDPMPAQMKLSALGIAQDYITRVVTMALNERLNDISEQANPPFMGANASDENYILAETKRAFSFGAQYKDGEWEKAMQALATEAKRVQLYGITPDEYDRAKANIQSRLDKQLKEKDDRKNNQYVRECLNNFLHNKPMPGIEVEKQLYDMFIAQIPLEAINMAVKELVSNKNLFIVVMAQDKPEVKQPTDDELLAAYEAAWNADVKPLEGESVNKPLISKEPKKGKIKKTEFNYRLGAKILTLSNGATVYLVHSDFKKDEILFRAYSQGGASILDEKDYYNYNELTDVAEVGGTGDFAPRELTKALAGKTVRLNASLSQLSESLSGQCAVKDLETLTQLIYLNFTSLRKDDDLFNNWKENGLTNFRKMKANPMKELQDSMLSTLYEMGPRFRLQSEADFTEVNYDRAMQLYRERFSNGADWSFVFVGNYDEATLLPLIEKYIASIPKKGKLEKGNEAAMVRMSNISATKEFEVPMETVKTTVIYNIMAQTEYTPKNVLAYKILQSCLDYVYFSEIREKESGVYGVGAYGNIDRKPAGQTYLIVQFDTNREQSRGLLKIALNLLQQIADEGPTEEHFAKAVEYMKKAYDNRKVENSFKLNNIMEYIQYGTYDELDYLNNLASVTPADVQRMAKLLVDSKVRRQVIMDGVAKEANAEAK